MQTKEFKSLAQAIVFRYDLKVNKIQSYMCVDVHGVYTVSWK